jgi:hypothetical protein
VIDEFKRNNIDYYINFGGQLDDMPWRNLKPIQVIKKVEEQMVKRLNFAKSTLSKELYEAA